MSISSLLRRPIAYGTSLVLLLFVHSNLLQAQQDVNTSFKDLSIEIQAYPTGVLYGLRFDTGLGAKSSGNVRLGYNMVRHRDLGVNEDERGGGFGGSLGYRYHLSPSKEKWFGGMRTDVWFNEVEWKNQIGEIDEDKGTTNIVVLQPTVEAGYVLPLGEGGWFLSPSIAFGFEINVVSDGKDVGQGAILLVGFSFGKRFR